MINSKETESMIYDIAIIGAGRPVFLPQFTAREQALKPLLLKPMFTADR